MWNVVGIDADGTRHICHRCESEEMARDRLKKAKDGLKRMRAIYAGSLGRAVSEYRDMMRKPARQRPKYYDYWGWKAQGFFIKKLIVEEVTGIC